jgi:hypothetical protein
LRFSAGPERGRLRQPPPLFQAATAEVRLRAERKAGEILAKMAEKGERVDRHGSNKKVSQVATPSLSDLDVNRTQSSRWQQIAAVPKKSFEAAPFFTRSLLPESHHQQVVEKSLPFAEPRV